MVTLDAFEPPLLLAAGLADGRIETFDLIALQATSQGASRHHVGGVASLGLSKIHGELVALTGGLAEDTVRIWKLPEISELRRFSTGHTRGVRSLVTTRLNDRPFAITASGRQEGTVSVWDLESCQRVGQPFRLAPDGFGSAVTSVFEGTPIAITGTADGRLIAWNFLSHALLFARRPTGTRVCAVATAKIGDDHVFVAGEDDGDVIIWRLEGLSAHGTLLYSHDAPVKSVLVAMNARRPVVVSGDEAGVILTWDTQSNRQIGSAIDSYSYPLSCVAYSTVEISQQSLLAA